MSMTYMGLPLQQHRTQVVVLDETVAADIEVRHLEATRSAPHRRHVIMYREPGRTWRENVVEQLLYTTGRRFLLKMTGQQIPLVVRRRRLEKLYLEEDEL